MATLLCRSFTRYSVLIQQLKQSLLLYIVHVVVSHLSGHYKHSYSIPIYSADIVMEPDENLQIYKLAITKSCIQELMFTSYNVFPEKLVMHGLLNVKQMIAAGCEA